MTTSMSDSAAAKSRDLWSITWSAPRPVTKSCLDALSVCFAVPVAVFDMARVAWPLQVHGARGDEVYDSFAGDSEHPESGEIVFAGAQGHAHARRTCRASGGQSCGRCGWP
jgi:hypothetical protein